MVQDAFEVGRIPPVGEVPPRMYAQVIRPGRFGEPEEAFQVEVVDTPRPGPDEALVMVMAAGINYNNVWAARGVPIDVTTVHARLGEPDDFHIGGSDASGVVWAFTGPVAILTDEGTASAAEMLAAGLQEAKRAVVVGDARFLHDETIYARTGDVFAYGCTVLTAVLLLATARSGKMRSRN